MAKKRFDLKLSFIVTEGTDGESEAKEMIESIENGSLIREWHEDNIAVEGMDPLEVGYKYEDYNEEA